MAAQPGLGYMSKLQTEVHPFGYAGKWFRTEEARDHYQWQSVTSKAAKRAGWPYKTQKELIAFDNHRKEYRAMRETIKQRDEEEKKNRDRIRRARGLSPNSNMMNVVLDPDPVVRSVAIGYVRKSAAQTAQEKIEAIRKLYEDGTPEREIIILVSQIVDFKGKNQ